MSVVRQSQHRYKSVRSMVLYVLYRNPEHHHTVHHLKDHNPCHLTCKGHATGDFIHLAAGLPPNIRPQHNLLCDLDHLQCR